MVIRRRSPKPHSRCRLFTRVGAGQGLAEQWPSHYDPCGGVSLSERPTGWWAEERDPPKRSVSRRPLATAVYDEPMGYGRAFYDSIDGGALRAARIILPMVLGRVPIRSAVDIGCGRGAWLRALQEYGVSDLAGYDGDYVERSRLAINPTNFTAVDLREDFKIARTFDIAISLEVVEHLSREFAKPLIQRLVTVAPIVLFSAAIPGQPGVNHVNEQWQDHWRAEFESFDFYPVDLVRPMIWGNPNIEYWYQQNMILYCSERVLINNSGLRKVPADISLNVVHPDLYEIHRSRLDLLQSGLDLQLRKVLRLLPSLAWNAIARRVERGWTQRS